MCIHVSACAFSDSSYEDILNIIKMETPEENRVRELEAQPVINQESRDQSHLREGTMFLTRRSPTLARRIQKWRIQKRRCMK